MSLAIFFFLQDTSSGCVSISMRRKTAEDSCHMLYLSLSTWGKHHLNSVRIVLRLLGQQRASTQ